MKKLLLILFLFTTINAFSQVKVGPDGNIIPTGLYPAAKSNNLKGTLHTFRTIVERNALPMNHRDTGMLAYVTDSLTFYYLYNGITNADWKVLVGMDTSYIKKLISDSIQNIGDIDVIQNTVDSSSVGIKKLDNTVKDIVIIADGLTTGNGIQSIQAGTGITVDNTDPFNPIVSSSGGGSSYTLPIASSTVLGGIKVGSGLSIDGSGVLTSTQVNSDWNAASGVAQILNKPTIPAQFNPIAGTGMTITGTYPNLTFNSTSSGGGSTYTASNGLNLSGTDLQLGGILNKKDTINTGTYNITLIGSPANFEPVIYAINNISSRIAIEGENTGNNAAVYGTNTGQGFGVAGYSSVGSGISGSSDIGSGGHFNSNTGNAIQGFVDLPNTNQVVGLSTFTVGGSLSAGTLQDGLGGSYNTVINNGRLTNSNDTTLRIISKWSSIVTRTSQYELWTMKDSSLTKKFTIYGNGEFQFNQYGSGTFTGTPAYNLGVDASGNVIETSLSKVTVKSTDPTTTDIPSGFTAVFRNSTSGFSYLWANVSGTLIKVQLN